MFKLREVSDFLGISRRTLQEYDRIGILHPTAKTEAGYWQYDAEAIYDLMLLRVGTMLGFKRREAKKLLSNGSAKDLEAKLDKQLEELNEEYKRIDGQIKMLKLIKVCIQIPEEKWKAFLTANLDNTSGENFTEIIEDSLHFLSGLSSEGNSYFEAVILLYIHVVNLVTLTDLPFEDPKVVENAQAACHYLMACALFDISPESLGKSDRNMFLSRKDYKAVPSGAVRDAHNIPQEEQDSLRGCEACKTTSTTLEQSQQVEGKNLEGMDGTITGETSEKKAGDCEENDKGPHEERDEELQEGKAKEDYQEKELSLIKRLMEDVLENDFLEGPLMEMLQETMGKSAVIYVEKAIRNQIQKMDITFADYWRQKIWECFQVLRESAPLERPTCDESSFR